MVNGPDLCASILRTVALNSSMKPGASISSPVFAWRKSRRQTCSATSKGRGAGPAAIAIQCRSMTDSRDLPHNLTRHKRKCEWEVVYLISRRLTLTKRKSIKSLKFDERKIENDIYDSVG